MSAIVEPILAGIIVSLLNKYVLKNPGLWQVICPEEHTTQTDNDDDGDEEIERSGTSIITTSTSDYSNTSIPHIHMHTSMSHG